VSRARAALVAVAVGAAVVVAGYGVATARAGASERPAAGPGLVTVDVDIRYSRFRLDELRVRTGTVVRFVVRNHDPINHEFVVGDAAVHAAHRHGTERSHPPVPGEVSVAPHDDGVTVMRFDRPGTVEYACHLAGHVAYGMVGEVIVVD
jgi:uncharacterized cupredoxin-like copper-binding protein